MNRVEAFEQINSIQEKYVNELISIIHSSNYSMRKIISFTSATGTGKTKMMSKLINKLPDYYFIITTLSKGQLHIQVRNSLEKDCIGNNFTVYGTSDYKINSKIDAEDILSKIPQNSKCIWLRDEGHIRTNRFDEILLDVCYKVINFSATNVNSDVFCKFTQTMMLRTVNQDTGTPQTAISALLKIKKQHKKVRDYNPCAIFRCVSNDSDLYEEIISLCKKNNLKYIDITDDEYIMSELCKDDNEYDVIINKYKIVEGIDIRRAHVLFMDNQPNNVATTIQAIGRCRRNALLYRDDVDILNPKNKSLLDATRECYVFFNVNRMKVSEDIDGELQYAFCNHISCEELIADTVIDVTDGRLDNGYYIIELEGQTGRFTIEIDDETGFKVVSPIVDFYKTEVRKKKYYLYTHFGKKICVDDVVNLPLEHTRGEKIEGTDEYREVECEPYYALWYGSETLKLAEELNREEKHASDRGLIKQRYAISKSNLETLLMRGYSKVYNDRESAIIGVDIMHQITVHESFYDDYETIWTELKTVTSKVGNYNKLNTFITRRYAKQLEQAKNQLFTGHNRFEFDAKCNSVLGYCVEYYSKYIVYGETYLQQYIKAAKRELNNEDNEVIGVVRACMLKYKDVMVQSFGIRVARYIKAITAKQLENGNYNDFINTVVSLGTKTAEYVKKTLYPDTEARDDIDTDLTIKHIAGVADYITEDTILDIKVRNNIDEKCIRQVLAYHYLSTKRSDLRIKRLIVYDAVSGKSIEMNIDS